MHLSSLASLTALLKARWMCGHAALSVPNPGASCLAVRCTRFLSIFAAERSNYASFPIQYSVSVDFRFTTLFRATWQGYYSVSHTAHLKFVAIQLLQQRLQRKKRTDAGSRKPEENCRPEVFLNSGFPNFYQS